MEEIWKDIPEYSGVYQISNFGRVRSYKGFRGVKERILKPQIARGYYYVFLRRNGKTYFPSVHRLVAKAFIPNPQNYKFINHKNEIKTDNRVENLEWCTQLYNNTYGTAIKRAAATRSKKIICIETGIIYKSGYEVCEKLNLKYSNVMKCCEGQRERTRGLHFKFANQ